MKPTNEVSKNTLQSILELFIRARSFSYVKDIVEKRTMLLTQSKTKKLYIKRYQEHLINV